jgi:hypothetical protein
LLYLKRVDTYCYGIFAVHEIPKLDPATLWESVHFLIGDRGRASFFNGAESTEDFTGFIITDRAARDLGEIHGAYRLISERILW